MHSRFLRVSAQICSLALLAIISTACSRASLKPGEIPPAEALSRDKTESARSAAAGYAAQSGAQTFTSGPRYDRVRRIVDRLSTAANVQGFSYPVVIAVSNDPDSANAAAVNGGSIIVFSALMDKVPNDDELAAVLGHELGHILAKHHDDDGAESRSSFVKVGSFVLGSVAAVASAYATGSSSVGNLAGDVTATATNAVGTGAFVRSYDRDMEREADQVGIVLMAKAGYNPQAAITFWKRADEVFGKSNRTAFMSTHPTFEDRAERLEELLPIAMPHYEQAKRTMPATKAPVRAEKTMKKKKA